MNVACIAAGYGMKGWASSDARQDSLPDLRHDPYHANLFAGNPLTNLSSLIYLSPPPGRGGIKGKDTMADHKQQLLTRLKTIEGHVRGVQRMVEADAYCIDVIKQTQAIQRALDKFNSLVLAEHLNGCVTTAIRGEEPQERERVVTELLQVFEATSTL